MDAGLAMLANHFVIWLLGFSLTPRYLLYRALGAGAPYIVGTWRVRVYSLRIRVLGLIGFRA